MHHNLLCQINSSNKNINTNDFISYKQSQNSEGCFESSINKFLDLPNSFDSNSFSGIYNSNALIIFKFSNNVLNLYKISELLNKGNKILDFSINFYLIIGIINIHIPQYFIKAWFLL